MCGRENKKSVFTRTPNPVKGQKLFEGKRIYCSDITGFGVRPFPDLVFEVERILHLMTWLMRKARRKQFFLRRSTLVGSTVQAIIRSLL